MDFSFEQALKPFFEIAKYSDGIVHLTLIDQYEQISLLNLLQHILQRRYQITQNAFSKQISNKKKQEPTKEETKQKQEGKEDPKIESGDEKKLITNNLEYEFKENKEKNPEKVPLQKNEVQRNLNQNINFLQSQEKKDQNGSEEKEKNEKEDIEKKEKENPKEKENENENEKKDKRENEKENEKEKEKENEIVIENGNGNENEKENENEKKEIENEKENQKEKNENENEKQIQKENEKEIGNEKENEKNENEKEIQNEKKENENERKIEKNKNEKENEKEKGNKNEKEKEKEKELTPIDEILPKNWSNEKETEKDNNLGNSQLYPTLNPEFALSLPKVDESELTIDVNHIYPGALSKDTLNISLIKKKEAMQSLINEYRNPQIQNNIRWIKRQKYVKLYRVRGDGNCFYRSFMFGYFKSLLTNTNECKRALKVFTKFISQSELELKKKSKTKTKTKSKSKSKSQSESKNNFQDFIFVKKIISQILNGNITKRNLRSKFISSNGDYFVTVLRKIIARTLSSQKQFYQNYINHDIDKYIKNRVLTMGCDADQIEIKISVEQILGNRKSYALGIFHLERSKKVRVTLFPNKGKIKISLLFRPGHYDVICQK
ncbi:ubiquitin thioesterase [Anaeramoeba flamelloides]|uniref:ubiquitinyl hydrolase 1 n=1 Tax=Anaeramoeba flamelloides TaxID=1746091 RepID=A0AAV7YXI2_9EUKA|nr:ubiquitin thioesterase [Anaeramoeba flamelloides]